MNKFAIISAFLLSLQSVAGTYEHGDLIIGHFWFDKMDSAQVADVGNQILKEDANFSSMAVVGTGKQQWGLYFRYNKSDKIKTNTEFSNFYQKKIKEISVVHRHRFGISSSDGVTVLK